jgi:putative transposase
MKCTIHSKALSNNAATPILGNRSMSRPANPYDNATCESFLKTLKREEIRAVSYHDFEELQCRIEEFIEQYYNRDRLHSALRYRSPDDFEAAVGARPQSAPAAILNFFAQ